MRPPPGMLLSRPGTAASIPGLTAARTAPDDPRMTSAPASRSRTRAAGRTVRYPEPASRAGWPARTACALGVAALAVSIFLPVLGHGFVVFDDGVYVTENPQVRAGLTWNGVRWAVTAFHASNWHPLTWLSHMLDWQVFGERAAGHHLVNVLLHAGSAVVLLLALERMTGALWRSAFVAAFFAIHPLHV